MRMLLTAITSLTILGLMPGLVLAADLQIKLQGVGSNKGKVYVGLFTRPSGFPKMNKSDKGLIVPANKPGVTVRFKDLRPGNYAIAAFHDSNRDGDLNTNLVGIPVEAYGFSNNARSLLGPPKFSEAALRIGEKDATIVIMLK